MSTYKYHILSSEESSTTIATYNNDRNITLVWIDEEAMMELLPPNSRAGSTINMLKEINGEKYKLYNNTDQFLSEIEHLCKALDMMVIVSAAFADVILRNLNESSVTKEIVSIVIFCASSHRDSCTRFLRDPKVSEICTNQSSLKAAIENEKNSSSKFVLCDRHLKPLFNLGRELETYSWYKKYVELLTDDCESGNKREKMLTLCTAWYETNGVQMAEIRDFYTNYKPENAAKWYAKDSFVYRVVNKALRTLDMESINAFRFYIKDLSKQLEELSKLQKRDRADESLKVYRGYANMTTLELDQIRQNIGGLISFNGFTSTTKDFEIALGFAISKPTHESVIFQILASYNLNNVIFADITQYSEFHENEIVFGLCSVFRITNLVRNEDMRVSIIEMTATDEDVQSFQNFVQKTSEAVIIENKNNRLLHCINSCHRRRRIILGFTIIGLVITSVAAALLSPYMASKHKTSNLYNCEGANCTTLSTTIDTSSATHEITSINTAMTELTATTLLPGTNTSASPKTTSQSAAVLSRWNNTGNMNNPRSGHTATVLANGHVLVTGGSIYTDKTNSTELYDPSTGTWTTTGSMKFARSGHAASILADGKVLVTGGSNVTNAELYAPSTGTWTTTGHMYIARVGHISSVLKNGQVLVTGGAPIHVLMDAELYDPLTETWTIPRRIGGGSWPRSYHTASVLNDGQVLIAGGFNGYGSVNTVELYDPPSESRTPTGTLNVARYHHTASVLNNGKVLVAGGFNGIILNATELYDPSTGSWTTTGSLNNARYYHTASILKNGKVLVTGGSSVADGYSTCLNTTELYDPSTETWTMVAHMNTRREGHTASVLLNGKVLVSGGMNGNGHFLPMCGELYEIS